MTAKVDTGDLGPSSGATGADSVPEGANPARVDEESKLIGAVGSANTADDVMNLGTSPNDSPSSPSATSAKPKNPVATSDCFAQLDFESGEQLQVKSKKGMSMAIKRRA